MCVCIPSIAHMPRCIYIKFERVDWQIADLEPGVYPLWPKALMWTVHRGLNINARRYGFTLVPDLAGTAHMYQGETQPGAIVDLQGLDVKPKQSDAMAGYVMISRVRAKETLLISQPFNPALFCLGASPGPKILMRVLRGELLPEEADAEFERHDAHSYATGVETDLLQSAWRCAACELAGCENPRRSMEEFGIRDIYDFRNKLLPQGAWARCTRCSRRRTTAKGGSSGGAANSEAQTAQRQANFQPIALRNKLAACQARGTCKQCHATYSRGEFWQGDWPHRHKYGGIKCTTCEPRAPGQREKYAVKGVYKDT